MIDDLTIVPDALRIVPDTLRNSTLDEAMSLVAPCRNSLPVGVDDVLTCNAPEVWL